MTLLYGWMLDAVASTADERFLFRSEKIFTVLAVLLIIWMGVVFYLVFLNKKISRLEKQIYSKEKHSEKIRT